MAEKKTVTVKPVAKAEAVKPAAAEVKNTAAAKEAPAKAVETKGVEEVKEVPAKAEESKAVEEKKPAPAKRGRKPGVKKAAEKKETVKKAAAKGEAEAKPAAKKASKSSLTLEFKGNSYTEESLVQSAKDVWVYDLGKDLKEFKTVELYVKPEEHTVYYVINKEVTGAFAL